MTWFSNRLLLLLLALLFFLLPSPLDAGRVFGKSRRTEKEEDNQADVGKDELPSDWTRSRHARRLETHVDEDDVLHLLRHDPVEMTLEEANDWQHVKRKLSEAREKSGWFHSVEDAFVPPNSALRRKKGVDGDSEENVASSSDAFVRRRFQPLEAHAEPLVCLADGDCPSGQRKDHVLHGVPWCNFDLHPAIGGNHIVAGLYANFSAFISWRAFIVC
jgi:hypothetical protein